MVAMPVYPNARMYSYYAAYATGEAASAYREACSVVERVEDSECCDQGPTSQAWASEALPAALSNWPKRPIFRAFSSRRKIAVGLPGREAADFRRPGAGRKGWIKRVDVETLLAIVKRPG
jgi:hypothetical protein